MSKPHSHTGLEVAVIGMAGRFPGAADVQEFWANLQAGVESLKFFSDDELRALGVPDSILSHPRFVKAGGGVLADKGHFDAGFFDYSPREAEVMDPQIRVLHECCWEALENAGYNPETYPGAIGLYAGNSANLQWEAMAQLSGRSAEVGQFASEHLVCRDFFTTRVSYRLNLKGPSMLVQSACSTSLVAIHLAARALLTGECKMALAGGVTINHQQEKGYFFQDGMISSPDGHCRAFDAEAQGAVFGSGAGVVVLKLLRDALADRDHVYAVIKGSAINNDGLRKVGYTAPSVKGQVEAIRSALLFGKVEPESVTYVETHGTGTPLGDPIEVEALTRAFNTDKRQFCAIGSVKTNVGHLDAAAGVTGFIKTVLSLQHRSIPPSLNYRAPNPKIDFANSPFFVNTALRPWETNGFPRRAGVSSFGIGGTNAHVVLEEAPELPAAQAEAGWQLVPLSARSAGALERMSAGLADHLAAHSELSLADVAFTLQTGRKAFAQRRVVVAETTAEAALAFSAAAPTTHVRGEGGNVVFMFSGQGSQYVNMGLELYRREPVFRAELDRCFAVLRPILGEDPARILYPDAADFAEAERKINQFTYTSPIKFSFEYALARTLMHWGIQPKAMIGHSFGEYVAACLAGIFSLEDALALVSLRGELMHQAPEGGMLSVPLPEARILPLLNDSLSLAAVNGPEQCIVSGTVEALAALEGQLAAAGHECVRLRVPRAAHSFMMEPLLERFLARAAQVTYHPPTIPCISGLSGEWMRAEDVCQASYWGRHLRHTVRFAAGLTELLRDPRAVFVQVGSDRSLTSFVEAHPDRGDGHAVLNLVRHPKDESNDMRFLLGKVGLLWMYGVEVEWTKLHPAGQRRRVPLPTYSFDHQNFWIDLDMAATAAKWLGKGSGASRRRPLDEWFYLPTWRRSLLPASVLRPENPRNWLILADESGLAQGLAAALEKNGAVVTLALRGTGFASVGERRFTLHPAAGGDFVTLLRETERAVGKPQKIVFMWGRDGRAAGKREVEEELERGFYSIFHLARAIGECGFTDPLEIEMVTDGLQAVLDDDTPNPLKSAALSALKVIPREYSWIRVRSLDVAATDEPDTLVPLLLREFSAPPVQPVVAYRGATRWLQAFEPLTLPETVEVDGLKPRGVYLVTGGFGGIGGTVAGHLAETLQARLLVVGRTALPARESWPALLADGNGDAAVVERIRRVQEWEARGAEVLAVEADLTDEPRLRAAVAAARQRWGRIDGVFHAAGLPGGGVIQLHRSLELAAVLQPKVQGTLTLERVLADEPPRFMVLFSSASAILPGFGQIDYGAANAFLDGFAQARRGSATSVVAVDWTRWKNLGMSVSLEAKHRQLAGNELAGGIDGIEGVAALRRVLAGGLSHVVVMETDFNAMVEEFNHCRDVEVRERPGEASHREDAPSVSLYQRPDLSTPYVAPQGAMEEKLAAIWQNFFGIVRVGADDSFFELGGDSLKATVLAARIHKELQIKVPLTQLFKSPTIRLLAGELGGAETNIYAAIEPAPPKDGYLLSSAQKRLFFLHQFENIGTSYNVPAAFRIRGAFDMERFRAAVNALIQRHETLRTSFHMVENEPRQVVHERVEFTIETLTFAEAEPDGAAVRRLIRDFIRPFDLSQAPLLRMGIATLSVDEQLLVYDLHHIIGDGTSLGILIQDFNALFNGEPLSPLRIQYKDFAEWQCASAAAGRIKAEEEYWLDQFRDEIPKLNLPTDFPRPSVFTFEGDSLIFHLGAEESRLLKELCAAQGATLFMNLLAAFYVLLFRYSGQEDIVVGCDIAGRPHIDLQRLIGMFVNELALRSKPTGEKTYLEFMQEVRSCCIKAFENQDFQFEELVDRLNLERDPSRNALFDVEFAFQNFEKGDSELRDVNISPVTFDHKIAKFDIALDAFEAGDGIVFKFEYYSRIFTRRTMEAMAAHFLNILRAVAHDPTLKLKDVPMLAAEEKRDLLFRLNDTRRDFPRDLCYPALFAAQVEKTPERIAAAFQDQQVTYRELQERAARLAHHLRLGLGVKPNQMVAIWMDRSIDFLVSILGVMMAGAAYLPIESSLPEHRIQTIIDDANVEVVLSVRKFVRGLDRLQWQCPTFRAYLCLDTDAVRECDVWEETDIHNSEELWNFVGESATDDITGGGWLTSYTGDPFTREEMEEYADNTVHKLEPLLHKDMRVLEIGCASGLTMYRVAPKVAHYFGIDISRSTVEKNKERIQREGHQNIEVACMGAHDIAGIRDRRFDLIIINSVIQSFHSHNYLRHVLRHVLALASDQAVLYVGDVMDLDRKQAMIDDLVAFKRANQGKNYKTKTDFSAELFISRTFFQDWRAENPVVDSVEFSDKTHTIANELTRFRFDTLIRIDKTRPAAPRPRSKSQYDRSALSACPATPLPAVATPDDLAYVIYTSGTTGRPKGVMIHQRGMINHLYAKINELAVTADDVIAQTASASFDISVWQFLAALITGGTTCIIEKEVVLDAFRFLEVLREKKVTILESVPSLMTAFLDIIGRSENKDLQHLRWMIPTGEALTAPLAAEWYTHYPQIRLLNAYGPTEASDDITHYLVKEAPAPDQASIPIGHPLQNLHIYILDNYDNPCPVGVRGEICVAGVGVGKGYWRDEEKTRRAFVPNPFLAEIGDPDYATIYRTGDIGYIRPDGDIECLGRKDFQVKIRGFRIELGDIETHLLHCDGIREAVVAVRETESGAKSLCAYLVSDKDPDVAELREYLARLLPEYMIPEYFLRIDKIPLSANGKADKKALPDPKTVAARAGREKETATPDEEKIIAIWAEVLGLDTRNIDVHDDFFELGGNSLNILKVKNRITEVFGHEISISSLFLYTKVCELAFNIFEESVLRKLECIVKLNKGQNKRSLFMLHPRHGMVFQYKELARMLENHFNVYGIQTRGLVRKSVLPETVELMAADYVNQILQVQPEGPYLIAGYCVGDILAYPVITMLEDLGHKVEYYLMFDSEAYFEKSLLRSMRAKDTVKKVLGPVFWLKDKLQGGGDVSRRVERFRQLAAELEKREVKDFAKAEVKPEDSTAQKTKIQLNIRELMQQHFEGTPFVRKADKIIQAPIIAFDAADSNFKLEPDHLRLMTYGSLQVIPVSGDHETLFERPHVEKIAAVLKNL